MKYSLVIVFFFSVIYQSAGQTNFFDVYLKNLENKTFTFSELTKKKGTVIVFLLSDCPASQDYTLTLNQLSDKYSKSGISLIGVFPGEFSTDDELIQFKQKYKIRFPLLKDPKMSLCRLLGAQIAPSCFLIDDKGRTIYEGRIDDWLYALGKKKRAVTQKNLEEAIISAIHNEPVKIQQTQAIGCILEYEK